MKHLLMSLLLVGCTDYELKSVGDAPVGGTDESPSDVTGEGQTEDSAK